MVDKLTVTNSVNTKRPITPVSGGISDSKSGQIQGAGSTSFAELLREKGIQLSNHANTRIQSRNIPTSTENVSRLQSAIDKASAKGAKECLVLMDNTAYLVALKHLPDGKASQTVVTVISKDELQQRIFTSIDSVVIA
ncbi:MAG: TIGR02530 family flagellar biosynthesis protein [bacterium]